MHIVQVNHILLAVPFKCHIKCIIALQTLPCVNRFMSFPFQIMTIYAPDPVYLCKIYYVKTVRLIEEQFIPMSSF